MPPTNKEEETGHLEVPTMLEKNKVTRLKLLQALSCKDLVKSSPNNFYSF